LDGFDQPRDIAALYGANMPTNQDLQDRDSHLLRRQARNERKLRHIIRLPLVEAVTGKKRSAIYQGVADGTFPAPVPLGQRAVGWLEDEIAAWQERCIAVRDERVLNSKQMCRSPSPARSNASRETLLGNPAYASQCKTLKAKS
jgi:prophage regulatory protein